MQNQTRPQPLTQNPHRHHHRANRQPQEDATWSSDSDSGITVDSHSPPSKVTPDSGIGSEQPPLWNLPPPPPSLLSDTNDPYTIYSPTTLRMSVARMGNSAGSQGELTFGVGSSEVSDVERRRQQEYVLSTLLEYERQQKMLQDDRGGGSIVLYGKDSNQDHIRASPNSICANKGIRSNSNNNGNLFRDRPTSPQNMANDYIPFQMARNFRHPDDVTDASPSHVTYQDIADHFSAASMGGGRDLFQAGDEGYGTDSRSNTTGSLASPLSSSLSSLITDSSASQNGSQRGGFVAGGGGAGHRIGLTSEGGNGPGTGSGSGSRAHHHPHKLQPVAGGGRLVIGKRGMLVKRKDLPHVERTDAITLEDRLRALTTIQEEDPASGSSSNPAASSSFSSPSSQRKEAMTPTVDQRPELGSRSGPVTRCESGSRSEARSGPGSGLILSRDGKGYSEGLYQVITKQRTNHINAGGAGGSARTASREGCGGGSGSDQGLKAVGDLSSNSLHRAAPLVVQPPPGDSSQRPGGLAAHSAEKRNDSDSSAASLSSSGAAAAKSGNSEGRTEVRFKAGGGGVKLNDCGQFEIDYSYYMKGSTSESNDEINTYSPTTTMTTTTSMQGQFGDAVREDFTPSKKNSTPKSYSHQEETKLLRWSDLNHYSDQDFGEGVEVNMEGCYNENSSPLANYSADSEHVYMNEGVYDPSQHKTPTPNLTLYSPPRCHSGDGTNKEDRCSQDGGLSPPSYLQSILKKDPALGSRCPSRRKGQVNRNSCDVGSLYRQSDLSHTFPPPSSSSSTSSQGVTADRLSLNLGDLPRIQEQLRATSEMLLSSGKRHQFASSSDIYKLFQGGRCVNGTIGCGGGFSQGRQPPHRRSFHDFHPTSSSTLLDNSPNKVRSRVSANTSISGNGSGMLEQSPSGFPPRLTAQGPFRADHTISAPPDTVGGGHAPFLTGRAPSQQVYGQGHDTLPSSGGARCSRDTRGITLRDRLDRGQQFVTDVIHGEEGEQLSTLV